MKRLWSQLAPRKQASEIAGVVVDTVRPRRELVLEHGSTAERRYREALAVKEQLFGTAHPEIAVTLNNLGAHYLDCGDPPRGTAARAGAGAVLGAARRTPSQHARLPAKHPVGSPALPPAKVVPHNAAGGKGHERGQVDGEGRARAFRS